jgi:hypothetical protein
MDRLGFADETVRHGRYGIAVVVVCHCRVTLVGKVMRGLVRPGLRRVHFSKQQDSDRRLILKHLVLEDIQAFFVTAHGRQVNERSECWKELVQAQHEHPACGMRCRDYQATSSFQQPRTDRPASGAWTALRSRPCSGFPRRGVQGW